MEDNGPGLSVDQQERVFHPYMSGYVSHNGMGIGLYTAYNMAKVHHGTLIYQRVAAEGGSRFILSIPDNNEGYSLEEYEQEPQRHDDSEDHSQSLQIIQDMAPNALNHQLVAIVEDAPDMQEQIKTEVGKYFRTVTYGTGEDALRDIAKVRKSFEAWGRPILLLFENEEEARKFNKKEFGELPNTIIYGIDKDGAIKQQIVKEMKLQSDRLLPIFFTSDTFNRVVSISQGYTIGLGEQLEKIIKKL